MEHSTDDHAHPGAPDDRLAVLQALLTCDAACPGVAFGFDVRNAHFVADLPAHVFPTLHLGGPMHLAIYNDLKLSQFILEHDAVSRPDYRWFTLTERGRRDAEGRST